METAIKSVSEFKPCVGCGYCCISTPCYKAVINGWGDIKNRCLRLYWDGEKYRCREVEENESFRKYMAVGFGCPSSLNTWRKDIKRR